SPDLLAGNNRSRGSHPRLLRPPPRRPAALENHTTPHYTTLSPTLRAPPRFLGGVTERRGEALVRLGLRDVQKREGDERYVGVRDGGAFVFRAAVVR
uniref:Uncharacterized protein n=1 Tax=Oryza brachyantha TaxID=4533 RepID=J3M1W0_ORYBR